MKLYRIKRIVNLNTHPSVKHGMRWFLSTNGNWVTKIENYDNGETNLFTGIKEVIERKIEKLWKQDLHEEWIYKMDYHSGSDEPEPPKEMPNGKEDYYYTEEDMAILRVRAYDDRLCRVAYNLWKIQRGDYFKELYAELLVNLKTEIIDKLKNGTLQSGKFTAQDDEDMKKMKEFTNTFIGLVKNLPNITRGFKTLESHIGIKGGESEKTKEPVIHKTAEQMIKEKLKNGLS